METISFEEVERIRKSKYREAFKTILNLRLKYPRTTSRRIEETLRLGAIARTLVKSYLEVVKWDIAGKERIIKVKT